MQDRLFLSRCVAHLWPVGGAFGKVRDCEGDERKRGGEGNTHE
jgi:hypothetical protein